MKEEIREEQRARKVKHNSRRYVWRLCLARKIEVRRSNALQRE
jgi:hypothetical protein